MASMICLLGIIGGTGHIGLIPLILICGAFSQNLGEAVQGHCGPAGVLLQSSYESPISV